MKTEFLDFYHRLEKDQRFEVIEFRSRYQKKMYKFIELKCPMVAKDLNQMKENYLIHLIRK